MTTRDRIVMMVVAVLVVAAGGWLLVVSPERKQAKKYEEQAAAAQTQLATAQTQLASAKSDQAQYASAYSSVVHLGKAVPASQEVASLVYQLEQVSNRRSVSFNSISSSGSSGSSPSSGASSASASASAGFTQMPFTFIFSGDFFSLEHLFHGLTNFTTHNADGSLEVNGRLLTIQSVKLTPEPTSKGGHPKLSGTVTATAYVLPPSQGVTGAATATSPSGAATPAASTAGSSTTPAVARVTP